VATFENVYDVEITMEVRVRVRCLACSSEDAQDVIDNHDGQDILSNGVVVDVTKVYSADSINLIGTTENVSYDLEYREQERETRATVENV
jgi:hypothetical protein